MGKLEQYTLGRTVDGDEEPRALILPPRPRGAGRSRP
jgi:hypothetical protein